MPRSDRVYSTNDLSRKSGNIIAEALRHPVAITQRNKPRLVLLNIKDYQRLRARADTMPEALLDELEAAVEAYAEDGNADR